MATMKNLKHLMVRLSALSVEHAYDPFRDFEWPDSLPSDTYWMSSDLLSVQGTDRAEKLTPIQLKTLSQYELVNFFSFNVHGIRDLMQHVLSCIHNTDYEIESDYFHHFLDEENKHMWFFAAFCRRYLGKIYVTQKVQFPSFAEDDIQNMIAFAKILISEQIGDFYNVRMMADPHLPAIVQKLNRVHHEDESRHIAMGRRVIQDLYSRVAERYPEQTLQRIGDYIRRYMDFFVQSFYNPAVYRDAGLEDPYGWRKSLINEPARVRFHQEVLRSTLSFFRSCDIRVDEGAAA